MIRARVDESSSGRPGPEDESSEFVRQIGEPDVAESLLESNAELSPGRFAASEDADAFTMNAAGKKDRGAAGRGKSSDVPNKAANQTEETDSDASDEDGGDAEAMPALEPHQLQRAIEAIIFSTGEPVTIRQLAEVFEVSVHDVREVVENIRSELEDSQRAFNLVEIGGGLQFLTQPRYHPWVSRFRHKRKAQRLSAAALGRGQDRRTGA